MVKKAHTETPPVRLVKAPQKPRMGRPAGDPLDVRSERLVMKIHPHLLHVYDQRSREAGMTRSAYIERVLLQHARFVEGAELDNIGRRIPSGLHHPNKSLSKMGSQTGPTLPNGKPAFRWPDEASDGDDKK